MRYFVSSDWPASSHKEGLNLAFAIWRWLENLILTVLIFYVILSTVLICTDLLCFMAYTLYVRLLAPVNLLKSGLTRIEGLCRPDTA